LPLSASRDHIGPMARTVRDAALLLNALAWYDEADIYSRDGPVEDYAAGLEGGIAGLRIGAFADDGDGPIAPDILSGFNAGLRTLEAAGAVVEPVDMAEFFAELEAGATFVSDVFAHHGHFLSEQPQNLSAMVRKTLEQGRDTSGAEVMDALRGRDALLHRLERRLRGFDLAVSPTLGVHLPAAGVYYQPLLRFTSLWDHNGWPAISVPAGLSSETGMPIGFQIIGRPWIEALLLRAARVIEQEYALAFPPSGLR
jgi:Asp-tRNA(Asn)/Glu-tRNA(Gln) amidotransferase A subunit family amidase